MENWCWERESLDLFARHHETGATIPAPLFEKMISAKNFRTACAMMRQIQFAKLDLLLHLRTGEFVAGDSGGARACRRGRDLLPTVPAGRTILRRFTHIFADPVGYAAGYYSYKWAEVLDADAFTRFRREGLFNGKVGQDFVESSLSPGTRRNRWSSDRRFNGARARFAGAVGARRPDGLMRRSSRCCCGRPGIKGAIARRLRRPSAPWLRTDRRLRGGSSIPRRMGAVDQFGRSSSSSLTARTVPATGTYKSEADFTDSTTPKTSPVFNTVPTLGSCTKVISPRASCACFSVIPMVAVPSVARFNHSCVLA